MRSFLLASAALCLSVAFAGCDAPVEPAAKPSETPPAVTTPATDGKMEPAKDGKMEPAKDGKMEPATTPAPAPSTDKPAEPPK